MDVSVINAQHSLDVVSSRFGSKKKPFFSNGFTDCQKAQFGTLGMHEGAGAPSYLIRSGGMYTARLEAY